MVEPGFEILSKLGVIADNNAGVLTKPDSMASLRPKSLTI